MTHARSAIEGLSHVLWVDFVFRAQVPSMNPLRLALGLKLRVVYFQFN
jgi:hypothetical protein